MLIDISTYDNEIKIFAGSSGLSFTQKICNYLNVRMGDGETIIFSDGNIFVRIKETTRNKDVFVVLPVALDPNNEFLELLFWIDAFKRASAGDITAVIPYFGYAKGDKKDEARVSIRGRVCADAIEAAGADRVVAMDLHSPQVQGFFKVPVTHLTAMPVLCEYIKSIGIDDDLTVVSPDAGFAKETRGFAQRLKAKMAICDKTRYDHREKASILDIIGHVEGKNCLIVDDFTISGSTLTETAALLKKRGAKKIYAAVTHLMLSQKGLDMLNDSDIEFLISSDTVDNSLCRNASRIKIVSMAHLFAEAILRIHSGGSVSQLFE